MEYRLKSHDDVRGSLVPINFSEISFEPKRIFLVKNCPKNSIRGNHAHFKTKQILVCIKGKIEVTINDGIEKKVKILKENNYIFIDNLTWDSQKFLTKNDVLMVICSTEYNKNDYILDFNQFLKIKKQINDDKKN